MTVGATDYATVLQSSIAKNVDMAVGFIPNLIAALVVFVVGWAVAVIVAKIVEKLLKAVKFEETLKKHGMDDALGKAKIGKILVQLTKYYTLLVFVQMAVALVYLGALATFVNSVLFYLPVLVGAGIMVVLSALVGELVKEKIYDLGEFPYYKFIGTVAKVIIVLMGVTVALSTVGFNMAIVVMSFNTVLQGITFGVAAAFALAFGLGGQDDAKDIVKKARKRFNV